MLARWASGVRSKPFQPRVVKARGKSDEMVEAGKEQWVHLHARLIYSLPGFDRSVLWLDLERIHQRENGSLLRMHTYMLATF